MFPNFTPFDILTDPSTNTTIHGIRAGTGPPLLLLHGFPQTHHIWHLVAPHLVSTYTVIALDLRGYGASSKPPSTPDHATYSKTAMAADCVTVMRALGHTQFFVCGHDRGARVAHQLCVNHPALVRKAIFLDICPTLAMYEQTSKAFAAAYWHWFFLIQPAPVPESLMALDPRQWLGLLMGGFKNPADISIFAADAFEAYVAAAQRPGTLAAMCEDYRAAASVDCEEQRRDREDAEEGGGRKIRCDVRVLWGESGVIERMFDAIKEWERVCAGNVSGESVPSGHYIPEEVPDLLVKHVKEFFA